LNIYRLKKVVDKEFCSKPFAFVLLPKDKYERSYLITANSEKEMNNWITEIVKVGLEANSRCFSLTEEESREYLNRNQKQSQDRSNMELSKTRSVSSLPQNKPKRKRQILLSNQREEVMKKPLAEKQPDIMEKKRES